MSENPYESPRSIDETPEPIVAPSDANLLSDYEDRGTGLMLFGIGQILIGGFCLLMVPILLFISSFPQGTGQNRTMSMAALGIFFALAAIILFWLGIGSIQAKRWARALTLVIAWIFLVVGFFDILSAFPYIIPRISEQAMSGRTGIAFLAVIMALLGIYLGIPVAYILFYRSKHVEMTCRVRDPVPRWTDRCPLPVLALSVLLAYAAESMLLFSNPTLGFPMFGTFVVGPPYVVVLVLLVALKAYFAWAAYKLKMHAWWGYLLLLIFWCSSCMVTFASVDVIEIYARMGVSGQQLDWLSRFGVFGNRMFFLTVCYTLVILGYLFYIRKYFLAGESTFLSEEGQDMPTDHE